MELKTYFALDGNARVIPNVSFYVYLAGTNTLAPYLEDENGVELPNPFSSGTTGKVFFAAPNGDYDIRSVKNGVESVERVQFNDVRDSVDAAEAAATAAEAAASKAADETVEQLQGRIESVIQSSGYQFVGDYEAGIELTEYNQVIRDANGEFWRVSGSQSLPYTTTGAGLPEGGDFVTVGDAALRQELDGDVANGQGALLVRGAVIYVDTIADLQTLPTSELVDGQRVATPQGGYVWSAANQKWIPSGNGSSLGFRLNDAIWSWWAKPCFLRHVDEFRDSTFVAFSESRGAVGVSEIDNVGRTISSKIVSEDFTPDDHNTGAVVAGGGSLAVFYPGRKYTAGSSQSLWYSESSTGSVDDLGSLKPVAAGGDYPNVYNVGDSLLVLARLSQTGTQWRTNISTWPIGEWDGAKSFFASESYEWPYIATRRSRQNSRKINLALGWHPVNEQHSSIYFGAIERTASGDWEFSSSVGAANLTDGTGLPLTENDFELAYPAEAGERTRLFDAHDNCFVFASFSEADPVSVYKYATKKSGTWQVYEVCIGGREFYGEGSSYFGGMSIDDSDPSIIYVAREDDRDWYLERYSSPDNGETWVLDSVVERGFSPSGKRSVLARPTSEVLSEGAQQIGVGGYLKTAYFKGSYSERTFEEFSTSLISAGGYEVEKPGFVQEQQGFCEASIGSKAGDARAGVLASRFSRANGTDSSVISSNECESNAQYGSIISSLLCAHGESEAATGFYRAIVASSNCTTADGSAARSFISGSTQCEIGGSGNGRAIVASNGCLAGGQNGNIFIVSSIDSEATASRGSLIGSNSCLVSNAGTAIIGGLGVASSANHTVLGGYGTGSPSTANRTWQFGSVSGNLQIAGSLSEGVNFSDIAKLIQNGEGSEIEPGYLLTLIGEKVYKAREGERVDAIVAATPGIIQNDTPFTWQGRYLRDEWGRQQTQEVEWVEFEGYEGLASDAPGDIPEDAVYSTIEVPIENPEYDPDQENVPRSERPDEWTMSGVHGIIRTRVDGSVTQAAVDAAGASRDVLFVEAGEVPGIGRLAQGVTNVQVMAVEKEFDGDYGIARCLLR